ncbi:hypothetical protein LshimejAT787_0207820 [Lyophyllum shimeji]|uniref:Uncharacterized protein n=1 Tax=Lyophyllum shimeji TaxID=47721 RepID=A0A9P3UJ87_LYOSH|nr:hypothetical protein LshimejAT787_0207820 [Lyophyllum shimeji]
MYTRSVEATTGAESAIPVAAIAGGLVAGSLLALFICLAWMRWRKLPKRIRLHHWKEIQAAHRTKLRTVQDTGRKSYILTYQPLVARPVDRKVKFAGGDKTEANRLQKGHPSRLAEGKNAPSLDSFPEVSKPMPLRSATVSAQLPPLRGLREKVHITGDVITSPPRIPHKPSTVSSASMYSTASGEEHYVRVPPNLILAATGSLSTGGGGERRSVASSTWSFLSRVAHGVHGSMYRHSQTSNQSAYSVASRDSSGAPVGLAV